MFKKCDKVSLEKLENKIFNPTAARSSKPETSPRGFSRFIKGIVSIMAALTLILTAFPVCASAADEGRSLVVGVNTDYGIYSVAGHYSGFAVDYLREIQKRTNHTITYVEGTAQELAEKLSRGEIDVIPCVTRSELDMWQSLTDSSNPKDPPELALSNMAITRKYAAVSVRDTGYGTITYNDFETLKSSQIGYLKENYPKYFKNGAFIGAELRKAEFVAYDTEEQMRSDFESGKIYAVVKDCFRTWDNELFVHLISCEDCYFMTSAENTDLISELDLGVVSLFMADSTYSSMLFEKYVSKYSRPHFALTESERHYIQKNPKIKVAFNSRSGVSEYNSSSNQISKTSAIMMKRLGEIIGMEFEIVPYETLVDCINALNSGEVQAICGGVNPDSTDGHDELWVSAPYSIVPIGAAGKKGSTLNPHSRIAISASGDDITKYILDLYPTAQIMHYTSIRECYEAVQRGEADLVFAGSYSLMYLINDKYPDMEISEITSGFHSECLAFSKENKDLCMILGKAIAYYTFNNAEIDFFATLPGGISSVVSGSNFFAENYLAWIISGLLLILAVVFIVLCASSFRTRREANTDSLTGGRSKGKFFEDARKLLKKNDPEKWAVVLFDIDKFKFVNDRLGYDEGNRMLERLHKTVYDHIDSDEIFARLSDDVFVMIIRNANDNVITSRVTELFNEFCRRNSLFVKYPVVFSAGVCRLNQCLLENGGGEVDVNAAIDRCKIAKSTLKGTHFSSIAFYDGKIRDRALREKDYEGLMPAALKRREFVCYLQPKYGLRSRNIEGAEALIRWNSKEFGFISPGDFIPIAEKNGFVVELDFFILEEVCRSMRRWIDDGRKPVVISVNQSRCHLNYDDYIWRLREIVDKYDIPYEYIELELTESVFTENAEKLIKMMHKLHEIGFKLSLDDFGSGYSSLNMLKDMPVDVVKIDKEFFSDTMNTQKGRAVISTVIDLAKNLDMDVISEGVETREQVEFLTEIHCAMVQGYYFAKPMPIDEFERLWFDDLDSIHRKRDAAAEQQKRRKRAQAKSGSENAPFAVSKSSPEQPSRSTQPDQPENNEAQNAQTAGST